MPNYSEKYFIKFNQQIVYKPARTPSVRYVCTMEVESEPRAKPNSPITEPVTQTIRDPYLVIAAPMKIPARQQQQQQQQLYRASTAS